MKVLVAVDGSAAAMEAVREALRLVGAGLRASLVLANVQEPATLYELLLAHDPEVIEQIAAEAGLELLEPARALVRAAGVEHEIEVARGDPAHTLIDIVENFGCVLTFEDIATIFYGDTPAVRKASRTRAMRRGVIGSFVFRLNERLLRYRQAYHIESVRGEGYRLVDGSYSLHRKARYTPEERAAILARYRALVVEHPDWTKKRRCQALGVPRRTVNEWLEKEQHHAATG